MPIVEYYSADTNKVYQFLARTLADAGKEPRCPDGENHRMERLLSPFAITGRASEEKSSGDEPDLTPAQEAAMMRLASKMEGISDENPDPRQLGQIMREMKNIGGLTEWSAEMEEVTRRLEAGEDPEKLEETFGDVLDDEGGSGGLPDAMEAAQAAVAARRRRPVKDPTLYELRDYIR